MASRFKKAVKAESKLRLALIAPSGGGKTMTALIVARVLSQKRIAVIDTERGSASKYADQFDFDVDELESHSPDAYCEAIEAAAASGDYDVLVIDSLSHAWMGRDGALEQVDKEASRSKSGSSFSAWRHVTPMHNRLVDTMVQAPLHVIATMRAKTEWVQEKDERGKTNIRKVGMAAVQREGVEYEFDVVGDMEPDRNTLVISKTRCPDLAGAVLEKPGPEFGETLQRWLAGAVTPFGRVVKAIMDARSLDDLVATGELAKGLSERDRAKLKPMYAIRRDRLQDAGATGDGVFHLVLKLGQQVVDHGGGVLDEARHLFGALVGEQVIGVFAQRQPDDLGLDAALHHRRRCTPRGLATGRVAVEDRDDAAGEAPDEAHLALGQRGAHRRDGVVEAVLMHL